MRWLTIAASLALACAPIARGAQSSTSASSSSTSTTTKHPTHKHKHSAKRQPGQKAPTSDRISEIQSALAREGYYKGDPNGKLDTSTVAALEKFQSDNGLDADGKLDAPTLQKLGLGSDIAGVAAPKPIVPACCSMSPSSSSSLGDKPASSCCSMASSQESQPSPSTPPASSNAGASGATSTESKPAQQ
ncbi:MAG TPA: peptidoglycan-binding domain-containing protein [Candidatus Acidoferrales bacterium]|nr:peptidoglycan-binding domain-containing protein [Candidatus Acidoferrales bacterium]